MVGSRAFVFGLLVSCCALQVTISFRSKVEAHPESYTGLEEAETAPGYSFLSTAPECRVLLEQFGPRAILRKIEEAAVWLNPVNWIQSVGNVMDISDDVEDLEELDMKPTNNVASKHCSADLDSDECAFDVSVFKENLQVFSSEIAAQVWLNRAREVNYTHHEFVAWLKEEFGGDTPVGMPGLSGFLDAVASELPEKGLQTELRKLKESRRHIDSGSSRPLKPQRTNTLSEVETALTDGEEVLAVQATTTMFDDPYWRQKLMEAMWPHQEHMSGYVIRTAEGKVGRLDGEEQVEAQPIETNKKLTSFHKSFSAYAGTAVLAWEGLGDELMQKIWSQAAPALRKLHGIEADETYILAFLMRAMKGGGILDRSGRGLPGPVWHKDVFADHVAIIYPFCFMPGYNNEICTREEYEKEDPGSKHLARFTGNLNDTVTVRTIPDGHKRGHGGMVAFYNDKTRHRALAPMNATREAVEEARMRAKDWGVPDNAIRMMLHITVRKKSWQTMFAQLATRMPDIFAKFVGPLVKCIEQQPWLTQMYFNVVGGFVDRN